MSTQWMKHALIASVLTSLITLPATAQQRRAAAPAPGGPAKPTAGTPGKLEVPPKLRPLVQRAIRATLQLQKARLEVLQVVKQLERLAATADQSSGVSLPTAPTDDMFITTQAGGVMVVTLPTAPTADRIKAGVLQAVAIPAFLRVVTPQDFKAGAALGHAVNITDLDASIVKVQKAIQDPVLRMEGNKLNFSISQPMY